MGGVGDGGGGLGSVGDAGGVPVVVVMGVGLGRR